MLLSTCRRNVFRPRCWNCRPVKLGVSSPDAMEIRERLMPGDVVVVGR